MIVIYGKYLKEVSLVKPAQDPSMYYVYFSVNVIQLNCLVTECHTSHDIHMEMVNYFLLNAPETLITLHRCTDVYTAGI